MVEGELRRRRAAAEDQDPASQTTGRRSGEQPSASRRAGDGGSRNVSSESTSSPQTGNGTTESRGSGEQGEVRQQFGASSRILSVFYSCGSIFEPMANGFDRIAARLVPDPITRDAIAIYWGYLWPCLLVSATIAVAAVYLDLVQAAYCCILASALFTQVRQVYYRVQRTQRTTKTLEQRKEAALRKLEEMRAEAARGERWDDDELVGRAARTEDSS